MKYNVQAIKRMKDQSLKQEAIGRLIDKRLHNQRIFRCDGGLRDTIHYICEDEYGESVREFWFEDFGDWTDEELEDYTRDLIVRNPYPWDCSGLMVTYGLTWHRNPSGLISFVHWRVRDW